MQKFTAVLLKVFLLVMIPTMTSCSSHVYDPNFWHENFVTALQNKKGLLFMNITGGWTRYQDLINRTELANGHITYKYRYIRTCRYTLEVDPKTDIVVGVDWEGDKRDCIIVP